MLMYGAEGMDVAERYNDWGVAAFILTYRLSPRYGDDARVARRQARDSSRARAREGEWNWIPNRIGYIGFSAGSNTGTVGRRRTRGLAIRMPPIRVDRVSSRPDYLALVYGAGRATPGESLKNFPPTFLVSAAADTEPSLG